MLGIEPERRNVQLHSGIHSMHAGHAANNLMHFEDVYGDFKIYVETFPECYEMIFTTFGLRNYINNCQNEEYKHKAELNLWKLL